MIASEITLTLVGGPTALIEFDGLRLLTDPTFDPPGRYETPTITHEKTSGPALTVEEVGLLDAVLLTHDQHFDNLDNSGRALLPTVRVTYTTSSGAGRLGGNALGLAPFETRTLEGPNGKRLLVTATPARHGPVGIERFSGDVVGFALGVDRPGDLIYITGDTLWYEGTAKVAGRFSPKLVILYTGSAEPRGRFRMTMGSEDALEAAHAFPDSALVSVHNEGWAHLRESQDQLADTFTKLGLAGRLTLLERGKPSRFAASGGAPPPSSAMHPSRDRFGDQARHSMISADRYATSEGIKGKVVLIAGGAGGIGSETAKVLASQGARVALTDINIAKGDEIVEAIQSAGGNARFYQVDVTHKDEVKLVVDTVVSDFGRLDVLVNSAGIMLIRPMAEVDTAEWETTIDLNVKGTLWGIAAALPVFLKQGAGHIINLGSVHGLRVFSPGGAVHSGSKYAIRAISEGLRAEMAGHAIRVTTVTPGAVDSGIQHKTTGTDSARILEIYKNAIRPSAVARAIAFAIEQPSNVDVNEIVVRPTAQVI